MTQLLRFEWDVRKSELNVRKHGISFEEAETVFYDEYARLIHDPEHSENEERYILLGMSVRAKMVAVCHCYREDDDVIRIISARRATKNEQRTYYHYRGH